MGRVKRRTSTQRSGAVDRRTGLLLLAEATVLFRNPTERRVATGARRRR